MLGWGYLTLGAAAAHTTGFVLTRVRPTGVLSLLLALSPVYCSAALVFLHPEFQNGPAMELYPAGLLISFIWQQAWPLTDSVHIEWVKTWMPAVVCSLLLLVTGSLAVYAFRTT